MLAETQITRNGTHPQTSPKHAVRTRCPQREMPAKCFRNSRTQGATDRPPERQLTDRNDQNTNVEHRAGVRGSAEPDHHRQITDNGHQVAKAKRRGQKTVPTSGHLTRLSKLVQSNLWTPTTRREHDSHAKRRRQAERGKIKESVPTSGHLTR